MLDTAQQKVENLTKEADTLLTTPPEISIAKEDVKVSYKPQDVYVTHSARYTPTTTTTLSSNALMPSETSLTPRYPSDFSKPTTKIQPSPNFPINKSVESNAFLTSPTASFNKF